MSGHPTSLEAGLNVLSHLAGSWSLRLLVSCPFPCHERARDCGAEQLHFQGTFAVLRLIPVLISPKMCGNNGQLVLGLALANAQMHSVTFLVDSRVNNRLPCAMAFANEI